MVHIYILMEIMAWRRRNQRCMKENNQRAYVEKAKIDGIQSKADAIDRRRAQICRNRAESRGYVCRWTEIGDLV